MKKTITISFGEILATVLESAGERGKVTIELFDMSKVVTLDSTTPTGISFYLDGEVTINYQV